MTALKPASSYNEYMNIAIVGGGASGTLAAIHLLRTDQAPLAVLLLERPGRGFGRGVAYGTPSNGHLLNVPSERMSALPDRPAHFREWLAAQGLADRFAPRALYGRYLDATLAEAAAAAGPGVSLRRLADEVESVEPSENAAVLRTRNAPPLAVDRVILAVGPAAPKWPAIEGLPQLLPSHGIADPWQPGVLDDLPLDRPVLLLGTGLTMVDVALSLGERKAYASLVAVSRRGLLPDVHPPTPAAAAPPPPAPSGLRSLVAAVRKATMKHGDARAVIDGLRSATASIWSGLSLDDRRRFLRHVRPYWDTKRHRMAPEAAARLASLRHSLRIVAGRVRRVAASGAGVSVVLQRRGERRSETIDVGAIVNCTGPADGLLPEPVVAFLLRSGEARRDAIGLGLDTAAEGAIVRADGTASPVLFTLGALRRGTLWETTAIPEIRDQAARLAESIVHSR